MSESQTKAKGLSITWAMPFAVIGIGALFLTIESNRLLVLGAAQGVGTSASGPIGLVFIALLAVLYFLAPQLFRSKALPQIVVAVLYSASKFVSLWQNIIDVDPSVLLTATILTNICEALLLFFWFCTLASYGSRFAARSFAYGIILMAILNTFTLLLIVDVARILVVLLPLVSVASLIFLRRIMRRRVPSQNTPVPLLAPQAGHSPQVIAASAQVASGPPISEKAPESIQDDIQAQESAQTDQAIFTASDATRYRKLLIAGAFYVSLACFALIFGQMHFQWVKLQGIEGISLIIQLSTSFGSVCGSFCIIALLRYLWSRRGIEFCILLMFGVVVMALWLSMFAGEGWVFLFVLLLNVVQKLTFMLILLSPFIITVRHDWLIPIPLSYFAFSCGKVMSSVLFGLASDDYYALGLIVSLLLLLVCSVITAVTGGFVSSPVPAESVSATQVLRFDGVDAGDPSNSAQPPGRKLQRACAALSEENALTMREGEILFLLAKGRTAHNIATSLVIAPATAKTHLRSIYAKLGVHTHQELLTLVEATITKQKGI